MQDGSVRHLEAAAVESKTGHNFVGWNPGLGDHGQCILGLGLVDMAAETAAVWTARAGWLG